MPPGKHALISVRQPKGNLIWIGTQGTAAATASAGGGTSKNDKDKYFPKINTWDECDRVQVFIRNVFTEFGWLWESFSACFLHYSIDIGNFTR